jgi:hypothetical protein
MVVCLSHKNFNLGPELKKIAVKYYHCLAADLLFGEKQDIQIPF